MRGGEGAGLLSKDANPKPALGNQLLSGTGRYPDLPRPSFWYRCQAVCQAYLQPLQEAPGMEDVRAEPIFWEDMMGQLSHWLLGKQKTSLCLESFQSCVFINHCT